MQLVILCGGRATRLGYLAVEKPKSLMEIHGQPLIDILIKEYRLAGFTEFVLLAGHLGDQLNRYKSKDIKVIIEKKPLGTGGAIIHALSHLKPHFYVVNSDTYIRNEDLGNFLKYSTGKTCSLIFNDTHAGLFAFNKNDLYAVASKQGLLANNQYNLEKDIMLYMEEMHYYVVKGKFWDIGTPESLSAFRKYYKKTALFLDRDGTIMEHVPYIKNPKDVKLIPNTIAQMREAKKQGYLLLMISNQAGPAKGVQTQDQFEAVHERMIHLLKEEGIILDDQFICTSPDDSHLDRKPNIGLIKKAELKWNLDLQSCILVGDRIEIDLEAGKRAGINKLYLTKDFKHF